MPLLQANLGSPAATGMSVSGHEGQAWKFQPEELAGWKKKIVKACTGAVWLTVSYKGAVYFARTVVSLLQSEILI